MFSGIKRHICIWVMCLHLAPAAGAQSNWSNRFYFSLGANLMLHWGPGQTFPGLRLNAAGGINAVYKDNLMLNYALTVSLFSKTVGANLNPLVNDVQLDVVNTLNVGGCWGKDLQYQKHFRTFSTGAYYNIMTNRECAVLLGTNFVLNNHKRNQFVGNLLVSTGTVTVNYYNDGGPPVEWLALGDSFDRWWTGGFALFFHNSRDYNTAEFMFDQFTGYKKQLYEISNILGIDVPGYENGEDEKKSNKPPDFNTSAYTFRYFFGKGIGAETGIIGSLRTRNDVAFGLQDMIHIGLGHSVHPNHDINRFFIGGNYIYTGE